LREAYSLKKLTNIFISQVINTAQKVDYNPAITVYDVREYHPTRENGVFVIGATNRIDLLDPALVRPGRIDKKIHISYPDENTRRTIANMYIKGKPHDESIRIEDFIQETNGFSAAQIENTLNEAMLNALIHNREYFNYHDLEFIMNKQMVGWQPNEHVFTNDIINRISVHEMGHAIVGMFSQNHAKVNKVVINLSSPTSPAYTIFENNFSNIFTKESLLEHLMVLLAGRIAEEVIYQKSITTGAINDFQESQNLAEQMIIHYGMGENSTIYSTFSENYKNIVDDEIIHLIKKAYKLAENILYYNKYSILLGSQLLQEKKVLYYEDLIQILKL
jgi:cell division protease FtsH